MAGMLSEKCVVITGGAGGIGRYLCEGLVKEGARLVIADAADPGPALDLVHSAGYSATAIACDLSREDPIETMCAQVEEEFGGCDVLLHVAADQPHGAFEDISMDDWRHTQDVNVASLVVMTQKFLPGMKRKNWGRIISFTSMQFYEGTPLHAKYVTSKAALIGLTRAIAREFGGYGVTANTIAPGLVRTAQSEHHVQAMIEAGHADFFELTRAKQCVPQTLEPRDLLGPVLFLASDLSRMVSGQAMLVDGGCYHL